MASLLLLPWIPLHAPFYGNTREPYSQLTVQDERIEGSVGLTIPLIGQRGLDPPAGLVGSAVDSTISWEVSLIAATFMRFYPAGPLTFDLIHFDGLFGLPIDLCWDRVELRIAWVHLSSHFADGIRRLEEKPSGSSDDGYSREWIDVYLARWWGPVRPYLGARLHLHAADGEAGSGLQAGLTTASARAWGPYLGADISMRQEFDWQPTLAAQTGLELNGENQTTFRIGLAAYHGNQDEGKLSSAKESYLGATMGFAPSSPQQPSASQPLAAGAAHR